MLDGLKIRLTNRGFRGKGIYIGRPSKWGNPYPVKRSKFSNKTYSLSDSLLLYLKLVQEGKIDYLSLKDRMHDGLLVLDCFCINSSYSKDDLQYLETEIFKKHCRNLKCHGEILAYFLLKEST